MSGFYLEGLQGLLERSIPAEALIFVAGINDEYTFNSAHDLSNINPDHIVLPAEELADATFINGVLDGTDTEWFNVLIPEEPISPNLAAAVIYFSWNAGANTSLLAYIDSASAGLPQTLTGVNVTAKWSIPGILSI